MASWKAFADRVITTDLLIIGSEGAGGTAAISARKRNIRVTIATKGSDIRRSGASVTGDGDISIDSTSLVRRFGLTTAREGDSPEIFFMDMVRGGKYLNNQKLVRVLVEQAPDNLPPRSMASTPTVSWNWLCGSDSSSALAEHSSWLLGGKKTVSSRYCEPG